MKVKVGTKIYDGSKEPVMVILTEDDKKNIQNMHHLATRYCSFPDKGYSPKEIEKWMKDIR